MPLKTRRFIFYGFLLLFIISGLGAVLYSQGWQPDIGNCRFTDLFNCSLGFQKTGAVFIETKPKGVVIKIDNKIFQDKSGLIQSGTLITNLLPKNYNVEIEKDGYLIWRKNLRIESSLVAELIKIVLFPEKLEKKSISISKIIDNFWINSQQKIVFKNNGALYYFPAPMESGRGSPNEIGRQDSSFSKKLRGDTFVQWSEDGNKVILKDSKSQTYYLYDFNDLSKTLNVSAVLNNLQNVAAPEIAFYPIESNKLIIKNKNSLYLLDLSRVKLENFIKESPGSAETKSILAWTIKNPDIYYLSQTSKSLSLVDFNLISKTSDILIDLPDNLTAVSEISASGNKLALLAKDGGLYLFNRQDKSLKQIAHSAEKLIFSPDNKKIVFLDKDGKINVYFLEDFQGGIHKKAGEIISLNSYLKENGLIVKNIFWYKDSSHLLVEYLDADGKQKIDFIEAEDRLPINKYTLAEGISNCYYEPDLNRLYFIQENNLYFLEF
jgi:hypothetical protein